MLRLALLLSFSGLLQAAEPTAPFTIFSAPEELVQYQQILQKITDGKDNDSRRSWKTSEIKQSYGIKTFQEFPDKIVKVKTKFTVYSHLSGENSQKPAYAVIRQVKRTRYTSGDMKGGSYVSFKRFIFSIEGDLIEAIRKARTYGVFPSRQTVYAGPQNFLKFSQSLSSILASLASKLLP